MLKVITDLRATEIFKMRTELKRVNFPNLCILLTATIDVKGISFMKRNDPIIRLEDYKKALRMWLSDPSVPNLIFCENSGFDLNDLRKIVETQNPYHKAVEFISYNGQFFPRELGKGYGEMMAISYSLDKAKFLTEDSKLIKVNGRYYVTNIGLLIKNIRNVKDVDIICDLSSNLTYADSRFFCGSVSFLKNYLCPLHKYINDSTGVYFEHILAQAVHLALANGRRWSLLPFAPNIVGVSGTTDIPLRTVCIRKTMEQLYYKIKRFIFER